jgi:catechol 2,3-dioxygenase-like lactoylglutathione lyase family enzyme
MRIKLTSIMVDNQDKALKFYTEIFGFVKKRELPAGEYRWLTVVSPDGPDDLELSLEPTPIQQERRSKKRFSSRASHLPRLRSAMLRRNSTG